MNELLPILDMVSTILLKITFCGVLIFLSWLCLDKRKTEIKVSVEKNSEKPDSVAPKPSTMVILARDRNRQTPAPMAQMLELIECERCRNEIKSRPILTDHSTNTQIYQCEHCGARVQA